LDDAAVRAIAAGVSKKVNERIRVLFIRYCNESAKGIFIPPKSLCAVSGKWNKIMTGVKEHFKNDNDRINEWLANELGEAGRKI
jgi:hypothetical protein